MVFLFLQSLSWFTNHGSYLKVPVVKGKNVDVAVKQLEDQGFEVVIQDSLYFDTIPKYTVIKQLPEPDATVKANRTVYLTINRAVPPDITMPKLEGLSLAYALDKLDRMHLKLGDTVYKPDFMKGSVLEQQYNSSRVAAGTKVPWGSRINLVIGAGLQEQQMLVPEVVGLTFADAKAILESKGISLAAIIPMSTVKDTAGAFVYKQNPEKFDADNKPVFMQPGQTMDLWLSPVPLDTDSIKVKNEQDLQ
jgi:beta-lactam-binding protein with PASTA domain